MLPAASVASRHGGRRNAPSPHLRLPGGAPCAMD